MSREKRTAICIAVVALLVLVGSPELARCGAGAEDYAGRYSGDGIGVHLVVAGDGGYTGDIQFNGKVFPLHARMGEGRIEGTFDSGGSSFAFTASLVENTLVLSTGTKTYKLESQNPLGNAAGGESAAPAKMLDYTVHDNQPGIDCDVASMRIPSGWGVKSGVLWSESVMTPGRWYVAAENLSGAESWILYPGQTFVWRDNFNLLGLNFQLHAGDSDPALGEEIEQPIGSASDCIKEVIIPRFRKDVAQAQVVSTDEMPADAARNFAVAVLPDVMNSPAAQQLQIMPKAATIRLEYSAEGRTVQEDFKLLVLYFDMPSGAGAVHVWLIPYCRSFRAEKGHLDDEESSIAKVIDGSIKPNAAWNAKRDEVIRRATQTYSDQLRQLAQAQEAAVIANMNRNIFNMTQQSFHQRMDMEQQTFLKIDKTVAGLSDYQTPDGQTIEASIAPLGQSAWRDGTGQVKFFDNGVNPNGSGGGPYVELKEK